MSSTHLAGGRRGAARFVGSALRRQPGSLSLGRRFLREEATSRLGRRRGELPPPFPLPCSPASLTSPPTHLRAARTRRTDNVSGEVPSHRCAQVGRLLTYLLTHVLTYLTGEVPSHRCPKVGRLRLPAARAGGGRGRGRDRARRPPARYIQIDTDMQSICTCVCIDEQSMHG